ncbi:hypothetical protein [Kribbella sp. VKM Ac-2571]|uniref:hypothetical protein n=1 Tax=Kribbella sp. VKM Ac-2571 TaxID=2512222 RepID=UPI001061CD11|nr:hypothetical protein [Kribbella sp. VKM Ac-2571]
MYFEAPNANAVQIQTVVGVVTRSQRVYIKVLADGRQVASSIFVTDWSTRVRIPPDAGRLEVVVSIESSAGCKALPVPVVLRLTAVS